MNRIALILLRNLHRLPRAYGKLRHYAKHTIDYSYAEKWPHIQYVMGLAAQTSNVDLQVTGLENIPAEGGFLLCGNHQGMFDVVAIAATCPRPLAVVYKKELKKVPILREIYACTHSLPMDREDVRQSLEVIRQVTDEVEAGRPWLIFPEGTRSKKGNEMNPFHGGTFRCATKSHRPVVPVAFIDSFRAFDQKGSDPITVQLHYLPPIGYEEYKGLKPAGLAQLVQARIQAVIDANRKDLTP